MELNQRPTVISVYHSKTLILHHYFRADVSCTQFKKLVNVSVVTFFTAASIFAFCAMPTVKVTRYLGWLVRS